MMVSATSLDTIRIEVFGEARAVTCPGGVWVDFRDKHSELLTERDRLREALTWAVGFIRCNLPSTSAHYPDMRNAVELIESAGKVITGEFQETVARAEVAEFERDKAWAELKQARESVTWWQGVAEAKQEERDAALAEAARLRAALEMLAQFRSVCGSVHAAFRSQLRTIDAVLAGADVRDLVTVEAIAAGTWKPATTQPPAFDDAGTTEE